MSISVSVNVSFRLNNGRKPKDKNQTQVIYIRVRKGRNVDFKASLGQKIKLEDWDEKKQRVRNKLSIPNKNEINNLLDGLKKHFTDTDTDLTRHGKQLTTQYAKKVFTGYFSPVEEESKKTTLFEFINQFIENATKNPYHKNKDGSTVKERTLINYKNTRNILKRFNDDVYKINFDNINMDFYNDFLGWCSNQNYSINYIGKQIKTLKTFLNDAVENGLTDNTVFKSKKFVTLSEDVNNIYLNLDELEQIWKLDLSNNEGFEKARNLFLIGAYTGLRISDYGLLNSDNIWEENGKKFFELKIKKSKQKLAIPIHPIVESIMNRYDGNLPPKMSSQKINEYIKKVGELAGINALVNDSKIVDGKKVQFKTEKFKRIASHTGRRSFCTNTYLAGMNALEIMALSGHKTEKSFLKYIKVTARENAIKMAEHSFFKPSSESVLKIS